MSESTPSDIINPAGIQGPSPRAAKDRVENGNIDPAEASGVAERRRLQNRIAQRNHRRKVREHISALEAKLVDNMLMGYGLTNIQTPSSLASQDINFTIKSPSPQENTLYESPQSITSPLGDHLSQPTDHMLDFPIDLTEEINQVYAPSSAPQPWQPMSDSTTPDAYSLGPFSMTTNKSKCHCCSTYPKTQNWWTHDGMDESLNGFSLGTPSPLNNPAGLRQFSVH
ncbi:hypothetical protein G7Y89_g2447 [Cudoniella acicularis]|uniref:BZIP domain-containing protein n=1 Tax=Cudoniella acicularis TaxID=354080 RepID=A0A8H4RWA2_9HELO|nr:hypothetical protein G7Y89_g2447 [Cudoniella acicularis]